MTHPAPDRPLRIAFVAPFPASAVLDHSLVKPKYLNREHPAPWVGLLAAALARRTDVILHVFVDSRAVLRACTASWNGATFTFTAKSEPLRSDPLHLFLPGQRRVRGPVAEFAPDVVVGFGAENGSALIAGRLPHPSVMFVQGIQAYTTRFQKVSPPVRQLALALERQAVRSVDGVVAETGFAHVWASRYQPTDRVCVIPHPLNPIFLSCPVGHRDPVAMCVGTLHRLKGVDVIIRAFAACAMPPARLVVVGRGPDQRALQQLAYTLGVGHRVTFYGHVPADRVCELMASARLLVMGSRVDTSPNAITEAHASGIPVISTRAGGIPDMVEDGRDGYLIDIDDHHGMADRLQILLEDAEQARAMGEEGRRKVMLENDPDRVADAHVRFYREVLQARAGRREVSPCAA